jgi:polyhydroxyalkanoate synthesis regulator phasin
VSLYYREPHEPNHSCPDLDKAIEGIESARKIHEGLREWGNWWKERAEELQEEVDSLEKKVTELEYRLQEVEE